MDELKPGFTILALETSCDETAAAVIRDGREIVSNVVASQMHLHERYGGVVPELASREHITSMTPVIRDAIAPLPDGWAAIDAVACTYGPGLPGALLAGVDAAKGLAWARRKPLVAVNHLEAHIYANWLIHEKQKDEGAKIRQDQQQSPDSFLPPEFPLVCLIVSGGHTTLALLRGHGDYQLLGQTRDDAAGEAFDKAARLMGLGYPGGPQIQKIAAGVAPGDVKVPRAWLGDSYDFSFSGVKTHILHAVQRAAAEHPETPEARFNFAASDPQGVQKLAAAFQESVVDVLVTKTVNAAQRFGARMILLAGGVAANLALRNTLIARSPVPVRYPPVSLCTDNAAMVGAAAYYRFAQGVQHGWDLGVKPNLKLIP
jgi:N6-L-threonylcarbamoyladenine synthase